MRAKQTKVCDAERADTYVPNYLKTDGQLIVQGRAAYSTPHLTASLAVVSRPLIILDATWIAKQAEGKWLGCRYILNGIQYEKMLCFLSGDLVTLLKRNSFDRLDVCNIYGNAKDVYTKKGVKNNAEK